MFGRSKSWSAAAGYAVFALLFSTVVNPISDVWAQHYNPPRFPTGDFRPPPPMDPNLNSLEPPSGSLQTPHIDPPPGSLGIPNDTGGNPNDTGGNPNDTGGSADEGDSPPPPPPPSVPVRIYINVACSLNDPSDDCEQDVAHATQALIDEMAEEAASSGSKRMLMVHFGSVLDRAEQIKLLFDIENAAIAAMEVKLRGQVRAAAPFQTQQLSPAEAQLAISHDVIAVKRINQEAREQANSGQNWSHDWQSSTHTFQSNAYNQLSQINLSGGGGWGGN